MHDAIRPQISGAGFFVREIFHEGRTGFKRFSPRGGVVSHFSSVVLARYSVFLTHSLSPCYD
jgi:hypothetical protein